MLIVQFFPKRVFFFFEGFGLVAARPIFFEITLILGGGFKIFVIFIPTFGRFPMG